MTMPAMNGLELCKRLHVLRADLPVILCSGFSEDLDKEKAKNLEGRTFLNKPISTRSLAETIRKSIDGREEKGKTA